MTDISINIYFRETAGAPKCNGRCPERTRSFSETCDVCTCALPCGGRWRMFGVRRFMRAADKEKHKQQQKNRRSARTRDGQSVQQTGKSTRVSLAPLTASSSALDANQPAVSAQLTKQLLKILWIYSSKHEWMCGIILSCDEDQRNTDTHPETFLLL